MNDRDRNYARPVAAGKTAPNNNSNDNNDGAMMEQPTATEIYTALRIARETETPEAAQDLQRIRERKTTWRGALENALRIEVDSFLRKAIKHV